MFLVLALAFLLMFSTLAVAENSTLGEGVPDTAVNSESDLFTQMKNNIDIYNENISSVPSFVTNLVDSKEILFIITLDDGSEMNVHGSTDEKGVFVLFEEINDTSGLEDALLVRSDESTAREIMNSSDPAYTLRLALKEKTVVIENASFFEGIVLWFAKSSLADILF
ncbi:hypothetical protein ACSAZK_15270 [Methanosarcina sp. Mfa9]|uniref:hypothetical protein n=1 Tax=Methanosarcina sp. Mfa9 TaxID=3439063 RepID=UPI003F858977